MPNDLEQLQGTWNVASVVIDGKQMPLDAADGPRVVVNGSRFTSRGMGAEYEGTLEIDQKKTPKTFDLVFTAGHATGARNLGIYKLDGKTWTICLATRGKRPRTFAARAGTGVALETLVRGRVEPKKADGPSAGKRGASGPASDRRAAPPAAAGAETILEGEWAMVAAVMNGAPMSDDMVRWCTRITRGDTTMVVAGPQTMLKATFTLDMSIEPHGIDYVNLEGANKGRRQAGIFSLRDGTLSICMAAPGKPRPADFASKPREGRSFTTWRRSL